VFTSEHAGRPVLVTSASDLSAASACEFAFLRRVDAKLGRDVEVPLDDDPMMARAASLGDAHEARILDAYRASHADVVEIPRPSSMESDALVSVALQTRDALRSGASVVFQGTFFDPEQRAPGTLSDPQNPAGAGDPAIAFLGFADFLVRTADEAIEVQDAKLARRAKVTALMQLAAYAEQLVRLGIDVAPEAVLILGDGARSRHRLSDISPVFRSRRTRLHEILLDRARAVGPDGERRSGPIIAWGAEGIAACGRCEVCAPEVERSRDPLLIAGISRRHRDRLMAAGATTIDAVAASSGRDIPGIPLAVVDRLASQARLQITAQASEIPPVEVVDPSALAAIPEPNPGDLFFDFEGDPLYREPGSAELARWGLDYLFGMVDATETYTALWAHDLRAEREALERFLNLVAERRRVHPKLSIYHYAAYERTHLLSIAARHGFGEAEVDQLLRENVLVDLYPIVRRAIRVGSRSYSIKKLEPLYMGDELRDEDGVTNGGQSVAEYAEATAQLRSTDPESRAEGQRRLDAIADYNRYDCVSTLRLRDWLLACAREHGVTPAAPDVSDPDPATLEPASGLSAELLELADRQESATSQALRLAASAIDYHRREHKSFWWSHFARLIDPIEDWADTRDVLIVDAAMCEVLEDWHIPERARTRRRIVRLRGTIAPGSSFALDADVFAVYDPPLPDAIRGAEPGARGSRIVRVLERHADGVTVQESIPKDCSEFDDLPCALTPGAPPPAGRQKGAIEEWGRELCTSFARGEDPNDPVFQILMRRPPVLRDGDGLVAEASREAAEAVDGEPEKLRIGAVIASLRRLKRSTLAVQGPPGTGKTYLAAEVIRRLVVEDGWSIGVVAQSHAVVENVLNGVVGAGLASEQVGKVPKGGTLEPDTQTPSFTVLAANGHRRFIDDHRNAGRGVVVGGTAWDFSHADRIPRRSLDLLVIDEAGQFSLAPTIAASVAAERLLLLGDPQQLPQVSQGAHPEPIDTSALGWLLGEHGTLPEELGYFLAETRRLRPELAEVISELSYEGRLHAHETAAERCVTASGPPGLVWHPVPHRGNSTRSVEEAAEVVRLARQACAATLAVPGQPVRRLTARDVIVVAPYNAQVECLSDALSEAGLDEIRVGTVDRFQGQEAVIALVSLAASSADDVPRGLEFLLMRNRLNVALSRAQWSAHLISSPELGNGLPASAEGVAALSGYLRLLERAHRPGPSVTVEPGDECATSR